VLGATNINTTTQDQAKVKLSYDFSPTLRANYTLGWWNNETQRDSQSFLRNSAGNAVYSGTVNINNRSYALTAADFNQRREQLEHVIHGLSLKSNTRGNFDYELAASVYRYAKDEVRTSGTFLPAAANGGAGTITDLSGTGWKTFAAKGTWRPQGMQGEHIVDFGLQQDSYTLNQQRFTTTDWINGNAGARNALSQGRSELTSVYAQDYWRITKDWRLTTGLRSESWKASDGATASAGSPVALATRSESALSPKLALAYQAAPAWALKASLGRAVRWPTVAELYQSTGALGTIINNDPKLRPEKSWTSELTAERDLGNGQGTWRNTVFLERTRDALYSQLNVATNVTNVQNVSRIATSGFETAFNRSDVGIKGLDLTASLTYTRSIIKENAALPASVGKWQPRVPNWRASLLATYKPDDKWSYSVGTRYSGRQYSQLDNSDTNENAYQSVSSYFVADIRASYRFSKQWSASLGIDNLNNAKYWAFHPYPQRTVHAELKFDL
jgi:iron complex outermembrane recepter protein